MSSILAENTSINCKMNLMLRRRWLGKCHWIIAIVVLLLLLAISNTIRNKDFKNVTGVRNLDATYHTLLTVKALQESSVTDHWLLPSVTLGGSENKNINWGVTVPTRTGDYIYTSFAIPGFFVPYATFSLFGVDPSVKHLARLNFAIGAIVSLILFLLLETSLRYSGYSYSASIYAALAGTTVSIFGKEVLQSHGLVYWSHSLYQVLLVSSLFLLFKYLTVDDAKRTRYAKGLCIVVFLGAWTEWSGYIFGLSVATLLWFAAPRDIHPKKLALAVILSLICAGLITVIHYGLALGFGLTLDAFTARFFARSTSQGEFSSLLEGYQLSFGPYLLLLFFALCVVFFQNKYREQNTYKAKIIFILFAASSLPLIENIVMLQHASAYTFDRLKAIFPIAILLAFAFVRMEKFGRLLLIFGIAFASLQSYRDYRNDLLLYENWASMDRTNKELVARIALGSDLKCTVLLSNFFVRGYTNLLFGKGVYEHQKQDDALRLMKEKDACSAVYLEAESAAPGLPVYRKAVIFRQDGSIKDVF